MDRKERSKNHDKERKHKSQSSKVNDNKQKSDNKASRDKTKSNGERISSSSVKSKPDDNRKDKLRDVDAKDERSPNNRVKDDQQKDRSRRREDREDRKPSRDHTKSSQKKDRFLDNPSKKEKSSSRHKSKDDLRKESSHRDIEKHSRSRDKTNEKNNKENSKYSKSRENIEDTRSVIEEKQKARETSKEELQSTSDGKKASEREKAMLEALQLKESGVEEDYNYDDDGFEDYDDDFESEVEDDETATDSFNDSEMSIESDSDEKVNHCIGETERLKIKEAMVLENSRVGSNSPSNLPSSPANTPVPSSPTPDNKDQTKSKKHKRGLDFLGAQKTQAASKALSKTARRGNDLVGLIELDTVYFDLLELKPQTEYELYMKSFGRSETYQKYTQYNDDALDKEIMTEPNDDKTCWTQHPIEASVASAHEGDVIEEDTKLGRYNPVTLGKFVSISTQIISTLLEERASRHGYTHTFKPAQASKISDTSAIYPSNQIASSRAPIFSTPISSQMFLVCYTRLKTDSTVNTTGLSCTWNLQNVYDPIHVLVSNAAHRCACVSSYSHNIVFIGCEDGSISLWDLNEPESMHRKVQLNNKHFSVRLPTYNTCGIQMAESHNSKITSLQAIKFDQENLQMSSFQIASLDEHGVIIIWVVVTVADSSFSGSQTDLGLRPGGKIKLVKSASINVNFPQHMQDLSPELRTFSFQQSFADASTYFVSTDKGAILKASRNQTLSQPTFYSQDHAVPAIVGSIDFNKFNWKYFICGSSDGSVSLYYVNRNNPLVVWDRSTRGRPVRSVHWSAYSSTIFYTMDSANKFYMWDLSVRDSTPLVIETYDEKGLLSFTELLPSAGTASPVIVFTFKDGSLEAHHVKEEAMNNKVDNITKLETYLSSVL